MTTAVIQSSSATTVAAVGFAGAGIIAFEQALGIILGANVGTTITGWIVALVGFKLKLGSFSYLLLLAGALLHLFSGKKWLRTFGDVLAGFALIFIGIDLLKEGMASVAALLHIPDGLGDHWGGRMLAVGFGVVFTLLTQSSSATIAATITAMSTGVIELPVALALTIGADIGTTATAALATVGGSVASRQTGWAHVLYNCMTGVMALLLLPLYFRGVQDFFPGLVESNPETITVAFHTTFNLLGVLIALPFTRHFASLVRHLVPDRQENLTRELDAVLLESPPAALDAVVHVVRRIAGLVVLLLRKAISREGIRDTEEPDDLIEAIRQCRSYLVRIISSGLGEGSTGVGRALALVHVLDHAERLAERCLDLQRAQVTRESEILSSERERLREALDVLLSTIEEDGPRVTGAADGIEGLARELESDYRGRRKEIVSSSMTGMIDPEKTDDLLDALRWIRRCSWHSWRIFSYLQEEKNSVEKGKNSDTDPQGMTGGA